jgi:hypothetical protein
MREVMRITDPATAAVFNSLQQRTIVQTLIGEPMSLSSLARETQTPMSLLHYHVSKCLTLGLVKVERVEPRAGRAVKLYRATAKTFFVPSRLLAKLPGAEMNRKLRDAIDLHQARTVEGVNFTHDGHHPCVFLVKERSARLLSAEIWLDVGLSVEEAASLVAEMKALLERYRVRDANSKPRYLVHMCAIRSPHRSD